jgi:hypothetical protein
MNRTDVKEVILAWSHRSDLEDQVDAFIDNTSQRLRKRLGMELPFTGQAATNTISNDYPEIYIYGGLREMGLYTHDAELVNLYGNMYDREVSQLNITAESTDFVDDTPAVLSEYEQAVIDGT